MPDANLTPSGDDYLVLGADQFTNPQRITNGRYVAAMNVINRGGLVQTRPGSRTLFTMPDGTLQGSTLFVPTTGVPQIVFAVSGTVYASPYPFRSYSPLANIQFSGTSRFIAWQVCLKSTDYDSQGVLYFLDNPYSVLMMQDGLTRAAYWDGTHSGHLDPTKSQVFNPDSGEIISQPGLDSTPVGLWMKWSNNRLWVSRGNQVFASDLGNPLKFVDAQYLNEGRAFYLPDDCTGIAETTNRAGIICFTSETGTFLQSSIQDRTQWLSTPDFQKTILSNIGCSAPRSIVNQYGLVWWYSAKGLVNQNDALSANLSSKLDVQDNQMFGTKENMGWDLSVVAGCGHENFVLISVPNGDKLNTRTMVTDQAPVGDLGVNVSAWASYWTGWRPVEWATGVIQGEERCFFSSVDYDGKSRMWEAFADQKTDNGLPITCWLQTRDHLFDNRDYKQFRYAEIEMREIVGDVVVQISAAGTKGAYQPVGTKEVVATIGQVYPDELYGPTAHIFAGSSPQTRILLTEDGSNTSDCNASCVESRRNGLIDKSFSLLVAWSGIAGVASYRIFAASYPEPYSGTCEINETGPNLLNIFGCGAKDEFLTSAPFTTYTATASYSEVDPETLVPVSYTATQTSYFSQADAQRKADKAAKLYVQAQIGILI
jgi:hypothetical protein